MKNKLLLLVTFILCAFCTANAQSREITSAELVNEVLPNMDKPVVIDFWASWCGPCRRYKPIYDNVARSYNKRADFYSINVDQNKELCDLLGVTSIPTTMVFYNTGEYYYQEGIVAANDLKRVIRKAELMFEKTDDDYF